MYPPPQFLADPGPLIGRRRMVLLLRLRERLLQLALDDVLQLRHIVRHVLHQHQLHVVGGPLLQVLREQLDLLTEMEQRWYILVGCSIEINRSRNFIFFKVIVFTVYS